MLPDYYGTKEYTLANILTGDELRSTVQKNILAYTHLIDMSVTKMLDSKEYSGAEKICAYETIDKLYNLFLLNEMDFALNLPYQIGLWQRIAFCYAEQKNKEKTIEALCKYRSFVLVQDVPVTGHCNSLFTDSFEVPYGFEIFNNEYGSHTDLYRKHLLNQVYDFIRDSKEWEAVLL